jgi:PLP dependent protein
MSAAENLSGIREKLKGANVTLIAVSKYASLEQMIEVCKQGVTEFGESRVQDALEKQDSMPPDMAQHIRWHFIGHLQTNKVKKAVGRFALIHSVDSPRLAKELNTAAERAGVLQPVLLQVKVQEDPGKSGFTPDELKNNFSELRSLTSVRIDGLMTMAPMVDDEEVWKKSFCGLRDLRDELQNAYGSSMKELSMGMSDDWQVAVACGATMVRIGRSIFEK